MPAPQASRWQRRLHDAFLAYQKSLATPVVVPPRPVNVPSVQELIARGRELPSLPDASPVYAPYQPPTAPVPKAPPTLVAPVAPPAPASWSGSELRPIVLPSRLIATFLSIASANTAARVETCAILAGRVDDSTLCVTHLLVPMQVGGPETCEMLAEERLMEATSRTDVSLTKRWW